MPALMWPLVLATGVLRLFHANYWRNADECGEHCGEHESPMPLLPSRADSVFFQDIGNPSLKT
jgi:hypothetical protein